MENIETYSRKKAPFKSETAEAVFFKKSGSKYLLAVAELVLRATETN